VIYYVCVAALLLQSALHVYVSHIHKRQWLSYVNEKEQAWQVERADLLNRIQAGNYAEYKTQEIRLIKAQNGEKESPKLEQL